MRGREAELARLEKLFTRPGGKFAVVCGPGGIGKSAITAELATRLDATAWRFPWRDQESLAANLMDAVGVLRVRPEPLWDKLADHQRWFLVVEDVDHPAQLMLTIARMVEAQRWGRSGRLLLITSENTDPKAWGDSAELITLGPLSPNDSAAVVGDHALATRLGGFPLALQLAGRAIAQHRTVDTTFTDTDPTAIVSDIMQQSLGFLDEEGHPLAEVLLWMLSLTADAPLPTSLVTPDLLAPFTTPREVTPADLDGLHRYGLVQLTSEPIPCVAVHRTIRRITLMWMSDPLRWRAKLDEMLLAHAEAAADAGPAGWCLADLLAPHLVSIAHRSSASHETLDRVALALRRAGPPSQVSLRRAVLDARLAARGAHLDIALGRHNLADALHAVGAYRQSAALYRKALADYEHHYGRDHPETFGSRSGLAQALDSLGEHRAAADIQEYLLIIRERDLGPDHYDTLVTRNDLAVALSNLGEHQRAADLYHQAYAGFDDVFGPDHRDTMNSRCGLAISLHNQGHFQQSVDLHRHNLADQERVLGPGHPDTRVSRTCLAQAIAALEGSQRGGSAGVGV